MEQMEQSPPSLGTPRTICVIRADPMRFLGEGGIGFSAPNSAGAPPQTPLGDLTALPRPHGWIFGVLLLRGGRGKNKKFTSYATGENN